jgi:hypothetical protein
MIAVDPFYFTTGIELQVSPRSKFVKSKAETISASATFGSLAPIAGSHFGCKSIASHSVFVVSRIQSASPSRADRRLPHRGIAEQVIEQGCFPPCACHFQCFPAYLPYHRFGHAREFATYPITSRFVAVHKQ